MRGWVMALAAPGQPVDLSGVMYSPAEVVEENGRNHRTILWFHVSLRESIIDLYN